MPPAPRKPQRLGAPGLSDCSSGCRDERIPVIEQLRNCKLPALHPEHGGDNGDESEFRHKGTISFELDCECMTPLTREHFEERLALAEQNVERARTNGAAGILSRKGGRPTAEGEMLLERLEHSVRVYEDTQQQLRQQLERMFKYAA